MRIKVIAVGVGEGKKENLAEIARLEQNLENLRVSLSYAKYEFYTDFNLEEIYNAESPIAELIISL